MRSTVALLVATAFLGTAAPAPARPHAVGHSERLAARARRGDRVARTTLVEEHMGIVRSVAHRYRGLGLPLEDLVQEGAIGLLAAIDEYDPGRSATFSSYAFWRIRAAITHAVTARGSVIRVPRPVLERRRLVAGARQALASERREPSVHELAAATALSPAQVAEALAPRRVVSLDEALTDGTPLAEHLADPGAQPDTVTVARTERRALRAALGRLRPRKRTILTRHFGLDSEPEPLAKIAADLRLSPERTRAIKDEALRELAAELTP